MTIRSAFACLTVLLLVAPGVAGAQAPVLTAQPPVRRTGPLIPSAIVLRATTPAETEANAVWNLRAALNIAALQCQFSPFLATVRNYNDNLKHHSEELTRAQTLMTGHFRRYDGAKGLNNFDMYTTRTYNSYSTLDAQYAFCEAASLVGREALTVPKGRLGSYALQRGPEIRASLTPSARMPVLALIDVVPAMLPPLG